MSCCRRIGYRQKNGGGSKFEKPRYGNFPLSGDRGEHHTELETSHSRCSHLMLVVLRNIPANDRIRQQPPRPCPPHPPPPSPTFIHAHDRSRPTTTFHSRRLPTAVDGCPWAAVGGRGRRWAAVSSRGQQRAAVGGRGRPWAAAGGRGRPRAKPIDFC